jgi:hypothetical protein
MEFIAARGFLKGKTNLRRYHECRILRETAHPVAAGGTVAMESPPSSEVTVLAQGRWSNQHEQH